MKNRFYKGRFIFFPLIGATVLALASLAVMMLWNNLLPDILHTGTISFWQAMGLFILSKILFGFGRGGKMGPPWMRGKMSERFNRMSPEEREKFKEEMGSRMCNWKRRQNADEPVNSYPEDHGQETTRPTL